jgi:hypothetical protein
MKVPGVLTTVRFDVDTEGRLKVSVDGQPHAGDRALSRDDLRSVLHEVTTSLGTAVRVEVHEADGTTYLEIETPPSSGCATSRRVELLGGPAIRRVDQRALATPARYLTASGN